ncbi:MAG TPA: hypothetical protein VIL48_08495 [Acidimicrobiales bacterium]
MARTRISTTVDGERLARARALVPVPDSELLDRALSALVDQILTDKEIEAITAMPYEDDPDLSWEAPPGPDLPYDGDIPADVRALAEQRRRQAS